MQTKPENGLAFSGKYFKVAKSGLDAGQGHRIRSRHSVKTIVDSLTVLTGPKGLTAPASVRVKYPVIPISCLYRLVVRNGIVWGTSTPTLSRVSHSTHPLSLPVRVYPTPNLLTRQHAPC